MHNEFCWSCLAGTYGDTVYQTEPPKTTYHVDISPCTHIPPLHWGMLWPPLPNRISCQQYPPGSKAQVI